jgi:hypothetical protein
VHGISSERGRAFTLVETLVVIGILVVLGALVLPIVRSVASVREDTGCLSNLRQIGLGIQMYSLDNDDVLPGPLYQSQYPYYNDVTQLSYHLKNYLNVDPTMQKRRSDVFLCMAHKRVMRERGMAVGETAVYQLNIRVYMGGEPSFPPFGYPNTRYPNAFGTNVNYLPMKKVRLAELTDENGNPAVASTWLLRDADKKGVTKFSDAAAYSGYPDDRVHRMHRNSLFYDFHVARTDVISAAPN